MSIDKLQIITANWELTIQSSDVVNIANDWKRRFPEIQSEYLGLKKFPKKSSFFFNGEEIENPSKLSTHFFFESTRYRIKVKSKTKAPIKLHHDRQEVLDALVDEDEPCELNGVLDFSNQVGLFGFGIECDGAREQIEWLVMPRKMDFESDYKALQKTIQMSYPSWLWSLKALTNADATKSREGHSLDVIWLKLFQEVAEYYTTSIKIAIESPHQRLIEETQFLKADRIKKIQGKMEERIAQGIKIKPEKRYPISKKKLTVDTPENRWLKFSLQRIQQRLGKIQKTLAEDAKSYGVSTTASMWLQNFQDQFRTYLSNPFFHDIGSYVDKGKESLVLQQRVGYSGAHKSWQVLQNNLRILENPNAKIGLKDIAELYELWCLLQLREILVDLGFQETLSKNANTRIKGLEEVLAKGQRTVFELKLEASGIKIDLMHEPKINRRDKASGMHSYTTLQKPDIWMEVTFPEPTLQRLVWIFDPKYRIKFEKDIWDEDDDTNASVQDLVPGDAIEQMHRYRDAIIHLEKKNDQPHFGPRTRIVVGAFALYPGHFNQNQTWKDDAVFPYANAIQEIGIGAFPLLPGEGNSLWLKSFLLEQLFGESIPDEPWNAENILLQDHMQIPPRGLYLKAFEEEALLLRNTDFIKQNEKADSTTRHFYVYKGANSPSLRRLKGIQHILVWNENGNGFSDAFEVITPNAIQEMKRSELVSMGYPSSHKSKLDAICYVMEIKAIEPHSFRGQKGKSSRWFEYRQMSELV